MAKDIIKEFVIVLAMLIIIALILGILLYDYIPIDKTIPVKVEAYKMPSEVEMELSKEVVEDDDTITISYSVESEELDRYERRDEYDAGKYNPFSTIEIGNDVDVDDDNTIKKEPNINTTK